MVPSHFRPNVRILAHPRGLQGRRGRHEATDPANELLRTIPLSHRDPSKRWFKHGGRKVVSCMASGLHLHLAEHELSKAYWAKYEQ